MSDITKRIANLSPERRELLERLLKQEHVAVARALIMPRKGDAGVAPLSFAQQRLWFLNRLRPDSAFYNLPVALRLTGALDTGALERSLSEIVRRHESLRTTFNTVGDELRQVIARAVSLRLSIVDLSALPPHQQSAETQRLVEEEARRPFDLARDPMLRAGLWTLSDDEHVLLLVMHHIVSDGWSMGVLLRELSALYAAFKEGRESPLAELPIQYADYAAWQREYLTGEVLAEQLSYWRDQLGGELPVLELPTDRPRPPVPSYHGAEELLDMEPHAAARLRALGRDSGATLFMTLLAAFNVLLYRYTGQEEIVVGTPVAGRTRAEVEELIGFLVNTLALRTKLSGRISFRELLGRAREVCVGAFAHQELPFEKVVEELQPERSMSHMPLFQVVFALQNASDFELELPGLYAEGLDTETETSKFDLRLSAQESTEGLTLSIRYSTDLFDAPRIRRMLEHYRNLLEAIAADPAQRISLLSLLTDDERRHLLARSTSEPRDYPPPRCLHRLFEVQVERTPDAVAIVSGSETLTYRELNERANQLARHLRREGVGRESLVGVCVGRGAELVAALLGVLKAGGAYVPLDPDYPRERLAFMVDDARVEALITSRQHAGKFSDRPVRIVCLDLDAEAIARESCGNMEGEVSPQNLAYVIYTSGSTGRPKGVMVTHANVARLFSASARRFRFGERDVWTLFHSYAFDFSVWELWGALLYGGRLVVVPYFVSRSPVEFLRLLREERVTVLNQTPSAFRQLMRADEASPDTEPLNLRFVIFGGEALDLQSLRPWFARREEARPRLVNMYGITETTVHVTYRPVNAADANGDAGSLIGVPIHDLELYVLDGEMQPSPVGITGELYVGGAGLARGYLNRAGLTAERFVPHPWSGVPGARLYKTGDVARLLDSGDIEFIGRSDGQVKIRGFRIELGEIETALSRHPAVGESVVIAREDRPGEKRLVAYVVGARGASARADELQSFLRERLPEHMIPVSFVMLDALPLTPSGKLNRRALPAPGQKRPDTSHDYAPPQTKLESLLADMWKEILGLDRVGVEDNFFGLGGDSIKGAVFINRLQDRLAEIVHVITIFKDPTIKQLAAYLNEQYAGAVRRMTGENAPDAEVTRLSHTPESATVPGGAARTHNLRAARMRELIRSRARRGRPAVGGKNPPAVFVLSPPRSGSTLFRVMLAGHPLLFAPPELELLSFDTLGERRAAFSGGDSFWLEGLVRAVMELKGCDAAAAKHLTEALEARDLTTKECYGLLQDWLGVRRLVDKTPSYSLDPSALEKAEADFDGALYIHLIRHPFGMIRSFEEARLEQIFFRHEHPFTRRELAELIWLVSHQNILRFLKQLPPERQHRVRFEELLDRPEAVLKGVCRFLNVDFVEDMIQPYRDKERRMTDGIHAESRMLGDVKFHRHAGVDARVGERWREQRGRDDLTPDTWEMAVRLGYQAEPGDAPAATVSETEGISTRNATGATHASTPTHASGGDEPTTRLRQAGPSPSSMLIMLQPHGHRPPFFCVHPAGGNTLCYVDLARQLGEEQPFYGLQSPEFDERGETLKKFEELAALYVEAMRSVRPRGPYLLGGWSMGGLVAFEMAQQLHKQGQHVALLALLDSPTPGSFGEAVEIDDENMFRMFAGNLGRRFGVEFNDLCGRTLDQQLAHLRERAVELNALPASMDMRHMHGLFRSFKDNVEALMEYEPRKYSGHINLFRPKQQLADMPLDPTDGWGALAAGGMELHVTPGDHYSMINMPHARVLAERLGMCIEAALAAAGATDKGVFS
ncbi:MAG: amino acid adenylation domain-containing protein [Acidobacteria bacterium]|nr:amino acid adenylation domain-containing protein [Acidobacteriota bacterium]